MRPITLWVDVGHGQFIALHYTGDDKVVKKIVDDFASSIRDGSRDYAYGIYELKGTNDTTRFVAVDFRKVLFIG